MDHRVKNISTVVFSGVNGMETKGLHLEPGEVSAALNFDAYQRLITLYGGKYLEPYLGRAAEVVAQATVQAPPEPAPELPELVPDVLPPPPVVEEPKAKAAPIKSKKVIKAKK